MAAMKVVLDDARLLAIPHSLRDKADEACGSTAKAIEGKMKMAIMDTRKTGRIYRFGKVIHQASAPGEPPATDTGNLVNSINSEKVRQMLHRVNVHAEYGPYLEYGTSRMSPRPFLNPAFEDEREAFKRRVDKLIAAARSSTR